jgi:cytochrome P450
MTARPEIDASDFNPFLPAFIHDPFPTWNRLREEMPITWARHMDLWVTTSHALNFECAKHASLSPSFRYWDKAPPEKTDAEKTDFDRMNDNSLFFVDLPQHTRLRRLTMPAFAKQVMQQIEERIKDVIVECFDRLGEPEEFDVYQDIATQIPIRAISRMVGVPKDAEDLFEHGLVHNLVLTGNPLLTPQQRQDAMAGTLPGFALLKELIAERRGRADPGDDFLGTLVGTVENGDRLSDWDIISLVSALIVAGADTVTDLHTLAINALLSHPDQHKLLNEKPELMEQAVTEILRHGAPGKTGLFRFALQDVEIGGQTVRKGQAIMLVLSSAWNDPDKWDEPRRFDIARPQEGNIVFGAGPHFCIGLNLVKVQGGLMVKEFSKRFPKASLTGEIGYDYTHHNARRINKLPVRSNLDA